MNAHEAALLPGPWFAAELLRLAGQRWRDHPCHGTEQALTHVILAAYRTGLDPDVIEWAAGIPPCVRARLTREATP
jgi:hypothetical protein